MLSGRVVQLCQDNPRTFESDYEHMVEAWLADLKPEVRPSLSETMMDAKRRLWNLSPIT